MAKKRKAHHIHHIASHFTNAMFPTAAIAVTLFLFTGMALFENTSLCCCVVGTFAAPVVYSSGLRDWYVRFEKRRGKIFLKKRKIGAFLMASSIVVLLFRLSLGIELDPVNSMKYIYAAGLYALSSMAAYLGYLGGKFIV